MRVRERGSVGGGMNNLLGKCKTQRHSAVALRAHCKYEDIMGERDGMRSHDIIYSSYPHLIWNYLIDPCHSHHSEVCQKIQHCYCTEAVFILRCVFIP